jgi:hypothetical protein
MDMFNYIMNQWCEYAKIAQFLFTRTDDNIFFMTEKMYWDFKLTNATIVLSYVHKALLNLPE